MVLLRSLFVESKKLRVFDFDDTLVKTTSFIYVTNKGKTRKLTPGQYAVYNEKPGDEFDFSDFSKVQNPNEIKKITKVLRRIVQSSGGDGSSYPNRNELHTNRLEKIPQRYRYQYE